MPGVSEQQAWHGTACSNQPCANDAAASDKPAAIHGNLQRRAHASQSAWGLYRYTADDGKPPLARATKESSLADRLSPLIGCGRAPKGQFPRWRRPPRNKDAAAIR